MKKLNCIVSIFIAASLAAVGTVLTANADDISKELNLDSCVLDDEPYTVGLSWNDINTRDETFNYQLFRRKNGGDWENRSIWNENEEVDVLNVFPYQPYLETWMTTTLDESEEPAGMGLFNIDSVFFNNFNADPASYMLDEAGNWKYDVIFFGSSDCNSYKDLNENSYDYVQRFADSGRGILFGHDTICTNFGHSYFCKFADQLGILVKNDSTVNTADSVSVVDIGTLTNFPWTIRGTLKIPSCHSYGQYVGGSLSAKEWLTLNTVQLTDDETGAHSNFYLVTHKNLGMIQTGHSNGAATDDERKILANTLFYLHQISQQNDAKDNSFYDEESPDTPSAVFRITSDKSMALSVSSVDNGTKYDYYISARSDLVINNRLDSNIVSETAISGIKGFVYDIDQNPKPMSELIAYDENNETVQNVVLADENGRIDIPLKEYEKTKGYYLHVFAVDNENNVSQELIADLDELETVDESTEAEATTTTTMVYNDVTTTTYTNATMIGSSTSTVYETTALTTALTTESTQKDIENTDLSEKMKASSPKTGDRGIYVYLILGAASVIVGLCLLYYRKNE